MFIEWQSFEDYINAYGLQRSEAVLLRHLSEVYKVIAQTVTPAMKTAELEEAENFFEDIVRGTDSSLLDEWEKLRHPEFVPDSESDQPAEERQKKEQPVTRNRTAFTRAVRNRVFDFVKELARGNHQLALEQLASAGDWTVARLIATMADHGEEHGRIRLDPEARNAKHCFLTEITEKRLWKVEQILVDEQEFNDWSVVFEIDLEKSDAEGEAMLSLVELGPVAAG